MEPPVCIAVAVILLTLGVTSPPPLPPAAGGPKPAGGVQVSREVVSLVDVIVVPTELLKVHL